MDEAENNQIPKQQAKRMTFKEGAALVRACDESGMSTAEYARTHNIDPAVIYRWRSKVIDRDSQPRMAQVVIADAGPDHQRSSGITFRHPRGLSVELPSSTSIDVVRQLWNEWAC